MDFRKLIGTWLGLGTLVVAVGCDPQAPVAEVDLTAPLPAVAAQFRTVVAAADGESAVEWRLWRTEDQIVIENLTERTTEYWERDGDIVFRRKLFHDERRGVEFQPGDLFLLVGTERWLADALTFDPQLLTVLSETRSGWRDGRPFRRYAGEANGAKWDIWLAVDLMIPTEIDRTTPDGTERTRLVTASSNEAAPWQPTAATGYELIDYADFGDRQADPFVLRVQSELGLAHAH